MKKSRLFVNFNGNKQRSESVFRIFSKNSEFLKTSLDKWNFFVYTVSIKGNGVFEGTL